MQTDGSTSSSCEPSHGVAVDPTFTYLYTAPDLSTSDPPQILRVVLATGLADKTLDFDVAPNFYTPQFYQGTSIIHENVLYLG